MLKQGNKVVVVGAGQVGATTAYTLLLSGLVSELVLLDVNEKKVRGEVLDLSHGIPLCPPADIKAGSYEDCRQADMVILTAGANQRPGETRMDLTRKNAQVFASIVPQVMRYAGPNVILLVVTNPVDVLTYLTWKLSGLPKNQVLGSGTVLDTSRLRYLLSTPHRRGRPQHPHLRAGRARRHGAAGPEPDLHRRHEHGRILLPLPQLPGQPAPEGGRRV